MITLVLFCLFYMVCVLAYAAKKERARNLLLFAALALWCAVVVVAPR